MVSPLLLRASSAFAAFILIVVLGTARGIENEAQVVPECGIAAVWTYLRHLGHAEIGSRDVTDRCRELYPTTDLSMLSLEQLRRLLDSFGVNAYCCKSRSREISDVTRPAILYLDSGHGNASGSSAGHFVLFVSVHGDQVEFVDFTTFAEAQQMDRATFNRVWTGFFLAGQKPPAFALTLGSYITFVAITVLCGMWYAMDVMRKRRLRAMLLLCAPVLSLLNGGCDTGVPLSVEPGVCDAGTLDGDESAVGVFRLTAWSRGPVRIDGVMKSCGCLGVENDLLGQVLPAGSSREFVLRLPMSGGSGPQSGHVVFQTDPPTVPDARIELNAFYLGKPTLLSSPHVDVAHASNLAAYRKSLTAVVSRSRLQTSDRLTVDTVNSDLGGMEIQDVSVEVRKFHGPRIHMSECVEDVMAITFQPSNALRAGDKTVAVKLRFESCRHEIPITYVLHDDSPCALSLASVYFAVDTNGQMDSIDVPFVSREAITGRLVTASASDDWIGCDVHAADGFLRVTIKKLPAATRSSGTVTIKCEPLAGSGANAPVVLPVVVDVTSKKN